MFCYIMSRKEEILEQAALLISEKGYEATTIRDIAESVGIEPSSVYSHFDSKEDILWEIALSCANQFIEGITSIVESDLTTRSKLTAMIIAHVEILTRNLNAAAIFLNEWRHFSEPRRSDFAHLRDIYEAKFRAVIAQGIEQNALREVDEKFGALTILSALNWTYQWYKPSGEMKPKEIGEKLAELLLNGLVKPF
ncbi:MAG: TetR/AcrR family transcriptional regulator [Bacteroidia bacterium]|nr:TetR/AcrR family transcriptional regulator [Bacteroidia bacterium]MDW8157769.1 TetR/AcrR family transcriptional regulator [Bacteroidia bacterium]